MLLTALWVIATALKGTELLSRSCSPVGINMRSDYTVWFEDNICLSKILCFLRDMNLIATYVTVAAIFICIYELIIIYITEGTIIRSVLYPVESVKILLLLKKTALHWLITIFSSGNMSGLGQ